MNSITKEEKAAIAALHRIEKKWPSTLWLFSANGTLCVTKLGLDGTHQMLPNGSVDPEYILDTIDIDSDGGDF